MAGWFASWRTTRAGRPDRISLAEADRLVSGRCQDPQRYGLGPVLDAVRAPAWAEELADGEEAVTRLVAARRAALSERQPRSRDAVPPARRAVPPARRKAAVALAATLGLLVAGGLTAAETGSLPGPVQQRAHDMFSLLGVPVPDSGRRPGPSGTPGPDLSPSTATPAPEPSPPATGTPGPTAPQVRTLCLTWDKAGRDLTGAGMDGPSWQALVALAGGRARVAALCAPLLATATGDAPTSAAPTSHPGGGQGSPSRPAGGRRNSGP